MSECVGWVGGGEEGRGRVWWERMYPIAEHGIPPLFCLSLLPPTHSRFSFIYIECHHTRAPFLLFCFSLSPLFSLCIFFIFASTHFAISAPVCVCPCVGLCVPLPISFPGGGKGEEGGGRRRFRRGWWWWWWPVLRAYRCFLCSRLLSALHSPFSFAVRRLSYPSPRFLTRPMPSRGSACWWRSLPPPPPKK